MPDRSNERRQANVVVTTPENENSAANGNTNLAAMAQKETVLLVGEMNSRVRNSW